MGSATLPRRIRSERRPAPRPYLNRGRRKAVLVAHIVASGAWLGAVAANLFLGISAAVTGRADLADAYYAVMDRLVNNFMPATAIATLATGLILSFGTKWGLLRHYWVVAKLALGIATVVVGVAVIDGQIQETIAARAAKGSPSASDLLLPAIAATPTMLVIATTLAITKPWGPTRLARRLRA